MSDSVVFRPAVEGDLAFIFKSWLLGQYHGNRPAKGVKLTGKIPVDYMGSIEQDVFMKQYHKFIESLLLEPSVEVTVACLSTDPDVVIGYSVFKRDSLIWVHVKPDWRNIGIARDLIPKTIKTTSSLTRVGDIIRKKRGWTFNPWSNL